MIKQSWKEHLQEHFWQLEKKYNASLKSDENKEILCPDPRCALSFDSVQALQCHCQDVHCVEQITLDPKKRRRRTHQSSLNVKTLPGSSIELESSHDLLDEKAPNKRVNESVDKFMLEQVSVSVSTESTGPPTSSACSNLSWAIDPRLLNEPDPQPIVLSP